MISKLSKLYHRPAPITHPRALPVSRRSVQINAPVTVVFRGSLQEERSSKQCFSQSLTKSALNRTIFVWLEFNILPN
jgi:hypothetical protein